MLQPHGRAGRGASVPEPAPAAPSQGQDEVEVSPPQSCPLGLQEPELGRTAAPARPVQRRGGGTDQSDVYPPGGGGRGGPALLWHLLGAVLAALARGWLVLVGSAQSGVPPLAPHRGVSLPALGPFHGPGVRLTRPDQCRRGWPRCPWLAGATGLGQRLYLHFASCFAFFFFSLSSDQKIPESSSTLTPPETLQLKTA